MSRHLCLTFIFLLTFASAARADYNAGKIAYDAKQWVQAISELRPLAEAGDDRAQFLLGKMYLDGNGVVTSPVEAMHLYRQAARKNNAEAMVSIATIYQAGIGYRKNLKLANTWFGRAAETGNQAAAFFYAISLFQGDPSHETDLQQNPAASYKWLKIAASMNAYANVQTAATETAKVVAARLKSIEIAQAEKEAAAWKPAEPATLGPLPAEEDPRIIPQKK
jgi:hypothetical protein